VLLRPVAFLGSSQSDLRQFPKEVTQAFGIALREAQGGGTHQIVKALKGFKGYLVFHASDSFKGDAYRLIYTAYPEAIYVIHAFKKKSTQGIATPQAEKDLIAQRLKALDQLRKGLS
jgi:phage-related protein